MQKSEGRLTSSQLSLRGVRILPGHILVNEKYQGSSLAKVLQGSVNIVFDNLSFLDFRPSADMGVLFLSESELIAGNGCRQRIVKLAKTWFDIGEFLPNKFKLNWSNVTQTNQQVQTIRGVVLFEKTDLTQQYCEQLQKFTSINVGLNLYHVSSQTEAGKLLIQLVNVSGNPRNNPFLIKKSQKPVNQALLLAVQTIPGLGEKKAIALLQRFPSIHNGGMGRECGMFLMTLAELLVTKQNM